MDIFPTETESLPVILEVKNEDSRKVKNANLPWLAILISSLTKSWTVRERTLLFKYLTLVLTFATYATYHLTRKVISVVTPVLKDDDGHGKNGWAPFNQTETNYRLISGLDASFLFAYSFGMYFAGHVAERVDLRYFLTSGMILSGFFTAMFGLGKFLEIHDYGHYVISQTLNGLAQSSGWPAVVPLVGNWFGYGRRGLIMGVWNSHVFIGNILGLLVAGFFVDTNWGLSFMVPAAIITTMGIIVFLTIVPFPEMVNCINPNHSADRTRSRNTLNRNEQPRPSSLASESNRIDGGSSFVIVDNEEIEFEDSFLEDFGYDDERFRSQIMKPAIAIKDALKIPGVIEFSLCLFFNKFVTYSFMYWLPNFISLLTNYDLSSQSSAYIATAFDFGGLVGGMVLGHVSDRLKDRAVVAAFSIILSVPLMLLYNFTANKSLQIGTALLFLTGLTANGPYALITTAVSADLGTHEILRKNSRALATVTALIDGTGSLGAAFGVIVCFELDTGNVFYVLVASNIVSLFFLTRLLVKCYRNYEQRLKRFCRTCLFCK
ncbi:glucose-6-phosphate exchanger SLC37A2-like [Convolutriloba macropyga]|uniref:glucose-6-phosphate exchanger SLC37A2-like n=1 Tax=Convolutriloba macropyga TaxID=536237 RepID=UPI003F51C5B7